MRQFPSVEISPRASRYRRRAGKRVRHLLTELSHPLSPKAHKIYNKQKVGVNHHIIAPSPFSGIRQLGRSARHHSWRSKLAQCPAKLRLIWAESHSTLNFTLGTIGLQNSTQSRENCLLRTTELNSKLLLTQVLLSQPGAELVTAGIRTAGRKTATSTPDS